MAYAVQCGQANGRWDLHYDPRKPHAQNRSVGLGNLDAGAGKSEAGGTGADADADAGTLFPNSFEGVFAQATPVDLSKQLADDYDKAWLRKDKLSRDHLKKNARDGVSEAQVRFAMLLQRKETLLKR